MPDLSVLLVAQGERLADAFGEALERRGVTVERATPELLVVAASVTAPDLVVLAGEAAAAGGREALAALRGKQTTASTPVALISDATTLAERLEIMDQGVVAVVPRSASADAMASRVAQIAGELDRDRQRHVVASASVDELVELFAGQLRSGMLSAADGDVSTPVSLQSGQVMRQAVADLVAEFRGAADPLATAAPAVVASPPTASDLELEDDSVAALLAGCRLVLIGRRVARSDMLVQELRAAGAAVAVADGAGAGLERARGIDPQVVMLDGACAEEWAPGALRKLRQHPRLAWASRLVLDDRWLWENAALPDLGQLAEAIAPLVRPDWELAERAESELAFDTPLEAIGPTRMLRALAGTGLGLRVSLTHQHLSVQVDLTEGLVAGARLRGVGKPVDGPAALATFCAMPWGRVHIERAEAPGSADVMAPVDVALAAADAESAASAPTRPSSAPEWGAGDAAQLARVLTRVEQLVERAAGQAAPELDPVIEESTAPDHPSLPPEPLPRPRARRGARASRVSMMAMPRVAPPEAASVTVWEHRSASSAPPEPPEPPPPPPEPRAAVPAHEPDAPARPPSREWIGLALAIGALVLATGGLVWALTYEEPEAAPSGPPSSAPSTTVGAAGAEPGAPRRAGPDRPDGVPAAPRPDRAGPPLGPGPAEPILGPDQDFTLAALGIERPEPAEERGPRARVIQELIRRANRLRNRGEPAEAQELYLRVLALDPDNPRATAGLARAYTAQGDLPRAITFAQRLVRLHPRLASNWVLLGDTLEAGRNLDGAARAWTRAIELAPRRRAAHERMHRVEP